MNEWQRVLNKWYGMGHIGLTVQQLSYITKIPTNRLLQQLKADKKVRWQICFVIRAPVVSWRLSWMGSVFGRADVLATVLSKLYRAPKYKGMRDWKGVRSALDGISSDELACLRKVARGK